jgi:predicted nuclease of predicted toxin-antitoxin system
MRVKIDEDLPKIAVQMLRDRGYQADSVTEQGMGGWKDPDLWQAVQAEHRFLITADKGFADVRFYAPGTHAGVLLLRPDEDGIRPVVELLRRVLESYGLGALEEAITVVTPRGVRIRHANNKI